MAIRTSDLAWQHQQVREDIDRVLDQILTDPGADTTTFVRDLEESVARWLGDGIYTVGVQSGLAAEFLSLKALAIGPGDEVITVPNSDLATTAAISHTGASFVLVDIDPRTHNIDTSQIETAITPSTKAIVPVDMYGLPAEMDDVIEIAERHDLAVVSDATLSMTAQYRDQPAGTLGTVGCYSFATGKVLAGTSNGGMIVTRDKDLAEQIRLLKGYGQPPERVDVPARERPPQNSFDHIAEGHNLKLDGMQAALATAKFPRLDEWACMRQAVANRYNKNLADVPGITLPHVPEHMRHSWRNYVINVVDRDRVREYLATNDIASNVLYIPPVHLQSVYKHLGLGPGSFPNAERDAESLLCLPMHPGLSMEDVDFVCSILIEAVGK